MIRCWSIWKERERLDRDIWGLLWSAPGWGENSGDGCEYVRAKFRKCSYLWKLTEDAVKGYCKLTTRKQILY